MGSGIAQAAAQTGPIDAGLTDVFGAVGVDHACTDAIDAGISPGALCEAVDEAALAHEVGVDRAFSSPTLSSFPIS